MSFNSRFNHFHMVLLHTLSVRQDKLTGGDLRQVQYQMRHTTTQMTEKYIDDWWMLDAIRNSWENKENQLLEACYHHSIHNPYKEKLGNP